ncbi:hypothetical protein ANAPH2_00863 [Anaplasma phagocytophilum]|nr:hypothetical protein ANAPH2_00863 [Anaplasma phagocytophilum]
MARVFALSFVIRYRFLYLKLLYCVYPGIYYWVGLIFRFYHRSYSWIDYCFLRYWENSPIRAYYKDITEILFCGISFSFENISECVLEVVTQIWIPLSLLKVSYY